MATFREWITRLWGALHPNRRDAELEQELRLHLDLAADDERRRANSAEGAGRAAVIRFGGTAQAMEALRDQRGLPWFEDLARDARYGLRSLCRTPVFAIVVLLTLAIGIGANTAVFSVVNAVLLKPLSYPNSEALVGVWHVAPGARGLSTVAGDMPLSPSMFFTYAGENRAFETIGVWSSTTASVTGLAEPEQVRSVGVTSGTLEALGVRPALGRWLSDADQKPGAAQAVMLGYGYWQRRFGGDPSVIGRGITVESRPREIVGVMPSGFRIVTADPELITPLSFDRGRLILPPFGFQGVARLKPGVTIEQASADVARMVPIWMTSWPAAPGVNPRIYESFKIAPALRPLKQDVVGNVGNVLWVVMGTIGIVMLIACANVANLLLVRGEGRQQEMAVRAALGAGSGRIVRALLIENVLLGLVGGLFGLALAYAGLRILVAMGPASLPRLNEIAIDMRALGFTLVLSLMSSLLFGLLPALKYGGARIAAALHGGGRGSSPSRERLRARNILVVVQVALALVLLVSSGLMIRTLQALRAVEPGFTEAAQLQTVRISLPPTLIPEPERVVRMQHAIVDTLAAIPGVASVAFATALPMEGRGANWDVIRVEGITYRADEIPPMRLFKSVSPGFFHTAGTRLIAGRDYTWADLYDSTRVVMVSENLARELWGSAAAAVGKRIGTLPGSPWREVIGVVQDTRDVGVHAPAPAIVYWPAAGESPYRAGQQIATRTVAIAIRSRRAGTDAFLSEVRQAVWSVNANMPLASVRTMQEISDQSMARTAFTLVMLAIAGAMALLLGIVGIYGVMSYGVSQRRREMGIRLALGAQRGELTRMVVRHGLVLAAVGVAIGLVAAVGLTRVMSSLLFAISPLDPMTFAAVPLVLALATLLASYLPARRAAAVDPVEALKAE